MKALKSLALAGLMMIAAVAPSHALIIEDDPGGIIVDFVKKYSDIRDRGETVVVDGECVSSCTLFLGIVPRQNYCITPNARLGFHTASVKQKMPDGSFTYSHAEEFSALMWNIYPGKVRKLIKRIGWNGDDSSIAHREIVYVSPRQLGAIGIRSCGPGDIS
ncbi:hypothetical protein [Bradyrhizobium ottawaense]|uniref:Uncharacterized protein n=1 Tax=Bradyrhizobium ottawaense TaxID=931866 RepID=A0ABY0QH76_9BRAD|nr:hypothetical protein [Bradyrhizobium ottawaense]SDK41513.1 hypothetical protein SAMN05444163_8057 [Bradyrhizobium ottawaense]